MNPNSKTILYVTYDGLSDPVSQSQVLPYLEKLSQNGISYHILSFEKKERLAKNEDKIWEKIEKNNWIWYPEDYTKTPAVLSTLYDIDKGKEKIRKILKYNPNISAIHVRSYIPMMMAFSIAKKNNIPIIFDMRGFWADERIDGHLWSLNNPIYRAVYNYFKKKERLWITNSDAVVVLTNAAKNYLINHFKVSPNNVYVIPCATDIDLFDPDKIEMKYDNHTFNLLYFGSAENWYLFDEMFEFYNEYRKFFSPSKFILILYSKNYEILEKIDKYDWHDEVTIIYNVPREAMPEYINLATHVIFFLNSFSSKGRFPIKLAETLAMGKPIITNKGIGDIDEIENDNCGVIIDKFDVDQFNNACQRLKNINFDSKVIRDIALQKYDLKLLCEKYKMIYDKFSESK
jgi:glycosyltransferase involved in cell wall biosynthesis